MVQQYLGDRDGSAIRGHVQRRPRRVVERIDLGAPLDEQRGQIVAVPRSREVQQCVAVPAAHTNIRPSIDEQPQHLPIVGSSPFVGRVLPHSLDDDSLQW